MKNEFNERRDIVKNLFDQTAATDSKGEDIILCEALKRTVDIIIGMSKNNRKLIFIGNGASASIASHMATDFWKNANIRAMAFNDVPGLTCISNDFGYEHVFEKPIVMFSDPGDVLIAISSSGESENILRAAKAAKANGLTVITLSGFSAENPLRSLGDINFYVPSDAYGHVEVLHHAICHFLVDIAIKVKNG